MHDARTNRPTGARWIAAALGFAIAIGIGFVGWRWLAARGVAGPAANDASFGALTATISRELEPRGLVLAPDSTAERDKPLEMKMSLDDIQRLFSVVGALQIDEVRYSRFRPGLSTRFEWAEHPNGAWTRITNSDGAREDHELAAVREDAFVLVAGDSHTEGMCDNSESFCNRAEAKLAAARPGKSVEVYNTGTSGYSFFNYYGALRAFLGRKPDVFVMVVYGGNDFFETLRPYAFARGVSLPPRAYGYERKLIKAKVLSESALWQCVNQALYLHENPDQVDFAVEAAIATSEEIRKLANENHVPWLVVYIPAAFDQDHAEWRELVEKCKHDLGLDDAALRVANRVADRWIAALAERGVEVVDLRPEFARATKPLYWTDLHIDLAGHELIAGLLAPRLERLLAERDRARAGSGH
jgi:lysophospholipase L1-like esterase